MTDLYLGIDLGTSGIRCAVVDGQHRLVAMTRGAYPDGSATGWWDAVCQGLQALERELGAMAMAQIKAAAVDGTSGSMVLVDAHLSPVTEPLMYNSAGFDAEAASIAPHAPADHITIGASSALARLLRLQSWDAGQTATHMCHQADFILARLRGRAGVSDENNCLKTGYDPETGKWPEWMKDTGLRVSLLPDVLPAGAPAGKVAPDMADLFGLSHDLVLKVGTTDSIAAFLATGAHQLGQAVTSLGTTLAIKMISPTRIDDPACGLYSHKLGQDWLVGGASNTGGGALLAHFSVEEMTELSTQIDPTKDGDLGYYPLPAKGERFPIKDPDKVSKVTPRPAQDHLFLHGLFEGIARIEAQCYAMIKDKGAPYPTKIFTAGGGGSNPVWTDIRKRVVSPNIETAPYSEAAIGAAFLASR